MKHKATMTIDVDLLLSIAAEHLHFPSTVRMSAGEVNSIVVKVESEDKLPADDVQALMGRETPGDPTSPYRHRGFVPNCCCTVFGSGESHGEG